MKKLFKHQLKPAISADIKTTEHEVDSVTSMGYAYMSMLGPHRKCGKGMAVCQHQDFDKVRGTIFSTSVIVRLVTYNSEPTPEQVKEMYDKAMELQSKRINKIQQEIDQKQDQLMDLRTKRADLIMKETGQ